MEAPDLTRHAPGVFGAMAAMLWVRDTWQRRVGYMLAGSVASHYGAPLLARSMSADEGIAGFLVGLFSMAVAAKCFEALESFKSGDVVERILKKVGL